MKRSQCSVRRLLCLWASHLLFFVSWRQPWVSGAGGGGLSPAGYSDRDTRPSQGRTEVASSQGSPGRGDTTSAEETRPTSRVTPVVSADPGLAPHEDPYGISGSKATSPRGAEAPALVPVTSKSGREWCVGASIPLQELGRRPALPVPTFAELRSSRCLQWMTAADERGREKIRARAQAACLSNARKGPPRSDPGAGLFQHLVPAGAHFTLDMLDPSSSAFDYGGARFTRGHLVARGAYGIVCVVQRTTSPSPSTAEIFEPSRGAHGVEPSRSRHGQGHFGSAPGSAEARSPPFPALKSIGLALPPTGETGAGVHTAPLRKPALRSAVRHGQGATGAVTSRAASKERDTATSLTSYQGGEHPSRGTPGEQKEVSEGASSHSYREEVHGATAGAPDPAAAAISLVPADDGEAFVKRLTTQFVGGKNLQEIYAMKFGLRTHYLFPDSRSESEEIAQRTVRRRISAVRRALSIMPQGFTTPQLYEAGFVLPLMTARVRGLPYYVGGSNTHAVHAINFVQLMPPLLTDLYSIFVLEEESTLFAVRRLLELFAHVEAAGFVHVDVKAENVGVDTQGNLMLLDFDYALREGSRFDCSRFPVMHAAPPEICQRVLEVAEKGGQKFCYASKSTDAWMLGILLFEMVCRSSEYFSCYDPNSTIVDMHRCIASLKPRAAGLGPGSGSSTAAPVAWKFCSPSPWVRTVIEGLLDLDPAKRLSPLRVYVYSDLFRPVES